MSTKRVQHIQHKSKPQALRGKPCPDEIKKAIELENCLPPDQEVPTFLDIVREQSTVSERDQDKVLEDIKSGGQRHMTRGDEWRLEAHQNVIRRLPDSLQEFIGPVTHETVDEAFLKLAFLSQAITLVRNIAYTNRANDRSSLSYSIPTDMILKTDKQGHIIYSPPPLLKALEGVEAARIRECQMCRKVFWAGRIDKPCCSSQCARNLRARRWRERYGDKYKTQRYEKAQKDESALLSDKKHRLHNVKKTGRK